MTRSYYHVAPRFTSGSPAQVDETTADQVAMKELNTYHRAIKGLYGEQAKLDAKAKGTDGIAYVTREVGKFMYVRDLITHARYRVPLSKWSGRGHWYERTDRDEFLERATTSV